MRCCIRPGVSGSPEGAPRRGKRSRQLVAALVSATTERKSQEKDGSLGVYDSRALVSFFWFLVKIFGKMMHSTALGAI